MRDRMEKENKSRLPINAKNDGERSEEIVKRMQPETKN